MYIVSYLVYSGTHRDQKCWCTHDPSEIYICMQLTVQCLLFLEILLDFFLNDLDFKMLIIISELLVTAPQDGKIDVEMII